MDFRAEFVGDGLLGLIPRVVVEFAACLFVLEVERFICDCCSSHFVYPQWLFEKC